MMDDIRIAQSIHWISQKGLHILKFWIIDKGIILQNWYLIAVVQNQVN
jgi:hypothetical protein